jgi:hypothetical protein
VERREEAGPEVKLIVVKERKRQDDDHVVFDGINGGRAYGRKRSRFD